MRAFVGVGLPQAYQDGLRQVRQAWMPRLASRLAWTRPGNWHVTLAFLGDVAATSVEGVCAALATVAAAPFTLRAAGAGFFPDARRPRVAWVGVAQGGAALAALSAQVWRSLEPLGFVAEQRPFAAHLTLARVRPAARDPWDVFAAEVGGMAWPEVVVDRFCLWRSDLDQAGPTYTALGSFALRGGA
ncbi:MAG: RNA 2',3'-cyclic phosphodiesterase [Desulfovibrionaceae bacterium]